MACNIRNQNSGKDNLPYLKNNILEPKGEKEKRKEEKVKRFVKRETAYGDFLTRSRSSHNDGLVFIQFRCRMWDVGCALFLYHRDRATARFLCSLIGGFGSSG